MAVGSNRWLDGVVISSLKPSPKNIPVIPSVTLAIWLAQPNNNRRLDGTAQDRPNLASVVNTRRLAAMVTNDKLLPQSYPLASTDTALIIRNRILSDQFPL